MFLVAVFDSSATKAAILPVGPLETHAHVLHSHHCCASRHHTIRYMDTAVIAPHTERVLDARLSNTMRSLYYPP
jgi:hypothetical protein